MLFRSAREFKFWDYNVSHKQALFRSPRTPEIGTNIDLIFWGVEFVEVATTIVGLEITDATEDQTTSTGMRGKKAIEAGHLYLVSSAGDRFFVAAAGFKILENTLDIFDSTLVYFNRDRPGEELGTPLAHS